MSIGIRNSFRLAADQTVTASVTLVTMGLTTNAFSIPLAVNQKIHVRVNGRFTLGASGGYKFQLVVPGTPGNFGGSFTVTDTVTPGTVVGQQAASAAFANALAVAGTHFLNSEFDYVNGATAGTMLFQFACNSAAGAIIALQGFWMDVTYV